jgi:two-component system, sensor histidine kinase
MSNADDTRSEGSGPLIPELAHELRDALSPLASSADLARLRNFDPEASRLLAEKVERGLRRALALLDTFVLAEQCERGTLPLQVRTVRLEEILESARAALNGGARYAFEAAGASAPVRADPGRSAQVLAAILQHVAALTAPDQLVEVCAAGTAVSPEIRVRSRVDPVNMPGEEWFASYRGRDGRMALRTAQRIMCLQGGALHLLKENDGGFELVVRFAAGQAQCEEKRHPSPQPQRPEPSRPGAAPRATEERILIVEDSPEVRRAYREALAALGYTVLEAADAEQALRALGDTRPDVALIDIHLPRMNGYRLAQAIRARAGAAIYLVMLSGMALDAVTRGLAREAGFDDCLDKMAGPVALRELLEAGTGRRG